MLNNFCTYNTCVLKVYSPVKVNEIFIVKYRGEH